MVPSTPRSALVLGAALAAALAGGASGAATGVGQGGGAGGGAASQGPILVSALLEDGDGDGRAGAGDGVLLSFDADVDAGDLTLASVRLLSSADSLGAGASVAVAGPRDVRVTLGQGAALSLYDTYKPGGAAGAGTVPGQGANRSPAAILVDAGAVRGAGGVLSRAGRYQAVTLPREKREAYQPEQSRGQFSPYVGQMHAHTSFSDGQGIPSDAYEMARANGLDWFVVTDHLEFLALQPWKLATQKAQADAHTIDGTFISLWGYEWGSGIANPLGPSMYNHANVLADSLIDIFKAATLYGFYGEVAKLGGDPIGKFNHPYSPPKTSAGIQLTFDNWDDYRYDRGADRHFRFVRSMQGDNNDSVGYLPFLDHGWHIAPAFGEDNHSPDWGASPRRMGVYASALTRAGVQEAMRARRTFTSSDRDAWVRVTAQDPAGEVWMGSTLAGPGAVTLSIEAGDPTDGLALLEVVSLGGSVVHTEALLGASTLSTTFTADPSDDAYYYARITEEDGDIVYSAPIFVDR